MCEGTPSKYITNQTVIFTEFVEIWWQNVTNKSKSIRTKRYKHKISEWENADEILP